MSRYKVYLGGVLHQTRGSGAGGVAPIPPAIDPGPDDYNADGVFLGAPAAATYPGGKFSVVGLLEVDADTTFAMLRVSIQPPAAGARRDAGFAANVFVEDETQQRVQALDQTATVTGLWTAWLSYSLDGSTFVDGPTVTFNVASLT